MANFGECYCLRSKDVLARVWSNDYRLWQSKSPGLQPYTRNHMLLIHVNCYLYCYFLLILTNWPHFYYKDLIKVFISSSVGMVLRIFSGSLRDSSPPDIVKQVPSLGAFRPAVREEEHQNFGVEYSSTTSSHHSSVTTLPAILFYFLCRSGLIWLRSEVQYH